MDLLYNLVREKRMNIVDLNIVEITNEYMSYIKSQQQLDIEIASEYLTMAATLLELKSKSLLPVEHFEIVEEESYSYDNFLEHLSKYEKIRQVSDVLSEKQHEYFDTYSPKKSHQKFQGTVEDDDWELNLSLADFGIIFQNILQKHQDLLFEQAYGDEDFEEINTLETAILSPQEITEMIIDRMQTQRLSAWRMEDLLDHELFSLKNFISIFLAILDLVKYQIVELEQLDDETLNIRFTKYALENPDQMNGLEIENYEQ
jgi:segregation and condensation protein A